MPKGRHKGARRQFTDFEAESERKEREEKEATWRANRGELPSDAEEGSGSGSESEEESESESSSSSSEEEKEGEGEAKVPKAKGVSGLIELENPNRQAGKATKKVTEMDTEAKPQLSRREREELEKQRATAHYRKMHAAGKTDEARADLERLAIIKQKRAEAEEKRKEQQEAKEAAVAAKKENVAKVGGKKKS